jgi:hypothetical protein
MSRLAVFLRSCHLFGPEVFIGRFEVFEEGPDFGLGPVQLPAGCVPRSRVGQETADLGPPRRPGPADSSRD